MNWLVSSGSSGFWFLSCVVSSVRKVWKLPASVVLSTPVDAARRRRGVLLLIAAVISAMTVGMDAVGHGLAPQTRMSMPPPSRSTRP